MEKGLADSVEALLKQDFWPKDGGKWESTMAMIPSRVRHILIVSTILILAAIVSRLYDRSWDTAYGAFGGNTVGIGVYMLGAIGVTFALTIVSVFVFEEIFQAEISA